MAERQPRAALQIADLHVCYGESHTLQGVTLALERGIVAVVGRNGMGKTTLCNTIVGLKQARSRSIRFEGREISALPPHLIKRASLASWVLAATAMRRCRPPPRRPAKVPPNAWRGFSASSGKVLAKRMAMSIVPSPRCPIAGVLIC